ncbi:ABC transporter permease subunit [Brucepastera parasyntrophica]|uniref:ABC transporter permease subunit n=1 Tax=Brucepastera parasyntrophica TaxID=2880008 RepID=UPI00210E656B|nr:hypothetical protein [Brucepastera parasyntrophica]
MKRHLPSVIALAAGFAGITVFLLFSGKNPGITLSAFFIKPFSSWWHLGNMLNMMGLILFAAAGSALALQAGTFNLGGEIQIYAPALVTAVMLTPGNNSGAGAVYRIIPALICACAAGAALGFIPGILRAKLKINELLSSFLLSAALVPVVDYLVGGPLRDSGKNLLATRFIPENFRIPPFLNPSYFNISFL